MCRSIAFLGLIAGHAEKKRYWLERSCPNKLRQLRDIHRDPSCLILAEQLGGGLSPRLVLDIHVRN